MTVTIPDALHGVNLAESALETIHAAIPDMDEEQLVATYQRAGELGKRSWLVQAHCLWEAKQRLTHHNDATLALLARRFGITQQYAGRLCGAWEAVPDEYRYSSTDIPLPKTFYNVAGQTDDPQGWAKYAEDKKAENPAFSIRDFQATITDVATVAAGRIAEAIGEVFSGGDWPEPSAPLTPDAVLDPIPADLRLALVGGEVGEHASVARWHAVTTHLYRAAREAQPLLAGWQPRDLAGALAPEEAAGLDAIGPLVDFVTAVVAARREQQQFRRIK